jgi:hypothetical protein
VTIDEMKQLKADTEKQICDLLMGFHDKTGMVITDPGVNVYVGGVTVGGKKQMAVSVDMQLSL